MCLATEAYVNHLLAMILHNGFLQILHILSNSLIAGQVNKQKLTICTQRGYTHTAKHVFNGSQSRPLYEQESSLHAVLQLAVSCSALAWVS